MRILFLLCISINAIVLKRIESYCTIGGDELAQEREFSTRDCACRRKGKIEYLSFEQSARYSSDYIDSSCDCAHRISYTCDCSRNFEYNEETLTCIPNNNITCEECVANAECKINTFDQTYCRCEKDYGGDPMKECMAVSPCAATEYNECAASESCNTFGMDMLCLCNDEWETCNENYEDVLECDLGAHLCSDGMLCRHATHVIVCGQLSDMPGVTRVIDFNIVVSIETVDRNIRTSIDWDDEFSDLYHRKSIKVNTILARVIGNVYQKIVSGFPNFTFAGIDIIQMIKDDNSKLVVQMLGTFTFFKRFNLNENELAALSHERDKLMESADSDGAEIAVAVKTAFIDEKDTEFITLIPTPESYTWTHSTMTDLMYQNKLQVLRKAAQGDKPLPDILEYLNSCEECIVFPMVPMDLANFVMPKPKNKMMNSLLGSNVYIDLCVAKDKKLFVQINASGEPPFQGRVYGVPTEYSFLVAVVINNEAPYDVSVGILDTEAWSNGGPPKIYLELRDSDNIDGNVTIEVSKSQCDKSAEVDKSVSLRQGLKPIQVSFLLDKADAHMKNIDLLSTKLYSSFNGVASVKAIEYVGQRRVPKPHNFEKRKLHQRNQRKVKPIPSAEMVDFMRLIIPEKIIRSRYEKPKRERREDSSDFISIDILITLYELMVQVDSNESLSDIIHLGAKKTAMMLEDTSDIRISTPLPVLPSPMSTGIILGVLLTMMGIVLWLATCCILITRSPTSKQVTWKIQHCILPALSIPNFWIESQLFVLYARGDGLMYEPVYIITAFLGLLPIIALLVFILKCYFAVKYRRHWEVEAYYKLYPLTMVLLLTNMIFHDLPQAILVYFYYARYKPPSFDLRIENLVQPCIDIVIVLIITALEGRNAVRYTMLFKTRSVKVLVSMTALPVVIVTPILKCCIVMSTLFNQLSTYTSSNSYDPMKSKLQDANGTSIKVEKIENEYDSQVNEVLDKFVVVKEWFAPRQSHCVDTSVEIDDDGGMRQRSQPNPFQLVCLNNIEFLMLVTIPFLACGLGSLYFLLRKLWPFLGLNTTLGCLCYLDDHSYKKRPTTLNWIDLRKVENEIKRSTMNQWLSAFRGLSMFKPKVDPFTESLKNQGMLGKERPIYVEYDLPEPPFMKKITEPDEDEISIRSINMQDLELKQRLVQQGLIGRSSQFMEYHVSDNETASTCSDEEAEPPKLSRQSAIIYEGISKTAYVGELTSSESEISDSFELDDLNEETMEVLASFRSNMIQVIKLRIDDEDDAQTRSIHTVDKMSDDEDDFTNSSYSASKTIPLRRRPVFELHQGETIMDEKPSSKIISILKDPDRVTENRTSHVSFDL